MNSALFPEMDVTDKVEQADLPAETGAEPRLRRPDRGQVVLEPVCLDERLSADHLARTIWRVVEQLDLQAFCEPIVARGSDPGRPATDPKLLVALWLYAAVDGIGNGRKLDRLCREHDAYKWLCGGVSLNYHTLNDFRVAQEGALDELFTHVLTALTDKGVVKVDRISQDGKRVRTSAGSSSFHREATLRRRLKEVRDYIEELKRQPDEASGESARKRAAKQRAARQQQERLEQALAMLPELEASRRNPKTRRKDRSKPVRVSRTDPEAPKMKMADGGIRPAYNMQLATDPTSGAIVGVDVVNKTADSNESGPLRDQVEHRTGRKVSEHLMDQGYVNMDQIDAAERTGVAIYAPLPKGKSGQPVTASRWDKPGTTMWRQRMQTDEAKEIYKQRAPASERLNAEVQERLGLRAFAVRGLRRVRCVALWTALAYNVVHFAESLVA
ncbi:MAG: IS1182 family transposase [Planctomycetota bacterium]|jgi:transposase